VEDEFWLKCGTGVGRCLAGGISEQGPMDLFGGRDGESPFTSLTEHPFTSYFSVGLAGSGRGVALFLFFQLCSQFIIVINHFPPSHNVLSGLPRAIETRDARQPVSRKSASAIGARDSDPTISVSINVTMQEPLLRTSGAQVMYLQTPPLISPRSHSHSDYSLHNLNLFSSSSSSCSIRARLLQLHSSYDGPEA
jgi:hypothetical protein